MQIAAKPDRQRVPFHVIDFVETLEQESAGCGKRRDRARLSRALSRGLPRARSRGSRGGAGATVDPHQRLVPDGERTPALAGRRAGVAREPRQEIGEPHEAPCRARIERRTGADDRRQRIRLLEAHDVFEELGAERPRGQPVDPRGETCDVPWRAARVRHEVGDKQSTETRVESANGGSPGEERREPDDERDRRQAPPRDAVGSKERPAVSPDRQGGVVVQQVERIQHGQRQQAGTSEQEEGGRERAGNGDGHAAASKNAGRLRISPVGERPQERRSQADDAVARGRHGDRPTLEVLVRYGARRASASATSTRAAAAAPRGAVEDRTPSV